MNELDLTLSVTSGLPTLRPVIDGRDLLGQHKNDHGLDPDRLLPPLSTILLPTRAPRRVMIGCCSCGETGCGSLALQSRRLGSQVLWEPDERAQYETLSRSYVFDLTQYLDAVDQASEDRPGEGRGRRVARRVRQLLGLYDQAYDSLTIFQKVRVDWVSAWPWDSDVVRVSVSDADGQQLLDYSPTLEESDAQLAVRIAADLGDRRYGRARG